MEQARDAPGPAVAVAPTTVSSPAEVLAALAAVGAVTSDSGNDAGVVADAAPAPAPVTVSSGGFVVLPPPSSAVEPPSRCELLTVGQWGACDSVGVCRHRFLRRVTGRKLGPTYQRPTRL